MNGRRLTIPILVAAGISLAAAAVLVLEGHLDLVPAPRCEMAQVDLARVVGAGRHPRSADGPPGATRP